MSRKNFPARHRAEINGNLALQGLSRAAKTHAVTIGRPVAIVAVTSGLAFSAVGTANAGSFTEQGTTAGATHTVVAGDTLGAISARYGADLNSVLAANNLSYSSVIFPGDTITIPTGGVAQASVQSVSAPAVAAPAQQTVALAPAPQAAPVQQTVAFAPAPQAAPVQQTVALAPAPAAPTSGVYLASTNPGASSGVAGTLIAAAQGQIGATQDCTVLVEQALRAAGISVGDLGPSQFFQFGPTVASPAPGDLVITSGHVGIYVGGGQVISSGMNGINATLQHPLSDLPGASFVRVGG